MAEPITPDAPNVEVLMAERDAANQAAIAAQVELYAERVERKLLDATAPGTDGAARMTPHAANIIRQLAPRLRESANEVITFGEGDEKQEKTILDCLIELGSASNPLEMFAERGRIEPEKTATDRATEVGNRMLKALFPDETDETN